MPARGNPNSLQDAQILFLRGKKTTTGGGGVGGEVAFDEGTYFVKKEKGLLFKGRTGIFAFLFTPTRQRD